MAKLFDTQQRIVPTWLEAARYLDQRPGRKAMNLVLEITDPLTITAEDRRLMDRVDLALGYSNLTLSTVAGTIFPLDLYRRYGRPAFYERHKEMLKRGKKAGTWGTYAARMIARPGRDGGEDINPLEMLVRRLSEEGQPHRKSGEASFASAYEMGIADPQHDLAEVFGGVGGEVPIYNVAFDGLRWMGFPCLSHLSFKRVAHDSEYVVNLTAVYRSHHYCARALGNLLGLGQLLWFVAQESGLSVGTLTCLSSHAELDTHTWGSIATTHNILTRSKLEEL